jgi:hypothetical protein
MYYAHYLLTVYNARRSFITVVLMKSVALHPIASKSKFITLKNLDCSDNYRVKIIHYKFIATVLLPKANSLL